MCGGSIGGRALLYWAVTCVVQHCCAPIKQLSRYGTAWKAALFLGLIVWTINFSHGALAALPAALKQATYTFFVAGFIVKLCENLAIGIEPTIVALSIATIAPSCIAIGLTFLVHSLKGTPEPLYSTLPTIIMAPPSFFVLGWRARNQQPNTASDTAREATE